MKIEENNIKNEEGIEILLNIQLCNVAILMKVIWKTTIVDENDIMKIMTMKKIIYETGNTMPIYNMWREIVIMKICDNNDSKYEMILMAETNNENEESIE